MLPTKLSARFLISGMFVFVPEGYTDKEVRLRRYFDFHEAPEGPGVSPSTHGVTPVWGFGTVVATSTLPVVLLGERVYGYFAPTRFLVFPVSPSDVNRYTFAVSRPHLPEGIIMPSSNLVLFFLQFFRQKTLQSNY
jgi:hypothetical protein